jgi:hypothetical protein
MKSFSNAYNNATDISAPFTCTFTVGGGESPADATFYEKEGNAAIDIVRGGTMIFSAAANYEDQGTYGLSVVRNYSDEGPTVAWDAMQIQDVTYDGYGDLVLLSYSGAYNFTYVYFAYNPVTHMFEQEPLLEVTNPSVDEQEQTIMEYAKMRGVGDTYISNLFKFMSGKYVLIETIEQQMVDAYHEEKGYVNIHSELKNGAMVETERTYLTYEEVTGEPYENEIID